MRRPRRSAQRCLPGLFAVLTLAGLSLAGCKLPAEVPLAGSPTAPAVATTAIPPTETPSPIPTPTPTPEPGARIHGAELALFFGDYQKARSEFSLAFEIAPDAETAAAALLGIGRAQRLAGETSNALQTFRGLIEGYPDTIAAGQAQLHLALVLEDLQRYEEAAAAYQAYTDRFPGVLDGYVYFWKADALRAAGLPLDAVDAYTSALGSPRLPGAEETIRIRIAGALADSGDRATALSILAELSGTTANETFKPSLLLLRGDLHMQLGQPEEAYALYNEAIATYPQAYDSYIALTRLVNAGVPVNEYDRGLTDYYAGEYSLAVLAFNRYLTANPDDHDGSAHYFSGQANRAIDSYDQAIADWLEYIQTHDSTDEYWDDAWEAVGDTQWLYLGDHESAISTYEAFTTRLPAHPRAAEFLFFAAQIAERDGQLERAVAFWERVINEYPTHWMVARSHFLAGITLYRLGQFAEALSHFQTIQSFTAEPFENSQATFWIGKSQFALGDPLSADLSFERAAAIDPTGYYSERARDRLAGRAPFALPLSVDLEVDWELEARFAEDWIRSSFALPAGTDFSVPGALINDDRFVRGTALWRLGFYELARSEFEALRSAIANDPVDNYRLAAYLLDLGMYRSAVFSARQVLNLAGLDDSATRFAPPWFNYIRFGLYYAELVLPAAAENDLHPLLVWSVIRQESLYEGFVSSTAGARGLMQIIPSTGAGIHANLGWPENYTAADLYRPVVNVVFGADYLADQRNYFSGGAPPEPLHIYAALAAYNGGPGNSAAWLNLAQGDPDLFLEVVRFEETRRYIRGVYEIYNLYVSFYSEAP